MSRISELTAKLSREERPLRWLASRLYSQFLFTTGLCERYTIDRGAYRIRFSRSAMALAMWRHAEYWKHEEQVIRRLVAPGATVVDVGANIGVNALLAAALVGRTGRVIAIEPHPRSFAHLCENVRLNGFEHLDVRQLAIGAEPGTVHLTEVAHDDSQNHVAASGGLPVRVETLDRILPDGPISLLKVDVEGYERFVFEGASRTLARTSTIYYEVHEPNFAPFGYRTSDLVKLLRRHGFASYVGEGEDFAPVDDDFVPPRCMNLIARRTTEVS